MRPQDLAKHFAALAEEFGLDNSEPYKRFITNMAELDHAVKSFIAGQKGEQLAKSSLRPLAFDPNVKILYNIALENDDKITSPFVMCTQRASFQRTMTCRTNTPTGTPF